jgi:hypothetical protein
MSNAKQSKRLIPASELAYNGLQIQLYHHIDEGVLYTGRRIKRAAYWEHVITCPDGYVLSDVNEHRLRADALKEAKTIVDEYVADPSLYRDDLLLDEIPSAP